MSFDAFLQCFRDGELDGFSNELLASAFAGDYEILSGDSLMWRLANPVIVDDSAPKTMMFEGREYPVVYCAGDCPPLVGREDSIPHLPQGLIDTLGCPVVLSYPLQIREMWRS